MTAPLIPLDQSKIAVIGLGYVGLPLAVEFAKQFKTVGFDISSKRIAELEKGEDITLERFEEMARFNYGSTVIVLLPPGVAELAGGLGAESPVKLGERLATLL